MTFDPEKQVKTKEGSEARILCTDMIGNYPIVALVKGFSRKDEEEMEFIVTYNPNGKYLDTGEDYGMDLINREE